MRARKQSPPRQRKEQRPTRRGRISRHAAVGRVSLENRQNCEGVFRCERHKRIKAVVLVAQRRRGLCITRVHSHWNERALQALLQVVDVLKRQLAPDLLSPVRCSSLAAALQLVLHSAGGAFGIGLDNGQLDLSISLLGLELKHAVLRSLGLLLQIADALHGLCQLLLQLLDLSRVVHRLDGLGAHVLEVLRDNRLLDARGCGDDGLWCCRRCRGLRLGRGPDLAAALWRRLLGLGLWLGCRGEGSNFLGRVAVLNQLLGLRLGLGWGLGCSRCLGLALGRGRENVLGCTKVLNLLLCHRAAEGNGPRWAGRAESTDHPSDVL
eukprot:m.70759 g.70759  ORF g.70759 m.70759 type:complete len:323 (+) comp7897_c1_seq2:248-1216(+)